MLLEAEQFDFTWLDLHVKPLSFEDMQLYIGLYTSSRVMRFICEPLTTDEAIVSFANALKINAEKRSQRLFLTVKLRDTEHAVGLVCISNLDRINRLVELGSMLLPQFHGKNIAKNAILALMAQVQNCLKINRFMLQIHEYNLPALRAAKLMGYRQDPSCAKTHWYIETS